MYQLSLDNSNQLNVRYKGHTITYGLDGSQPNPLEATYAAIAGCAGVYARKACKALLLRLRSMGVEKRRVKLSRVPNKPGLTMVNKLHNSSK